MKINTREDDYCIVCKYWIGKKMQQDIISGEGDLIITTGLCGKRTNNISCNSNEVCSFLKEIFYIVNLLQLRREIVAYEKN